jgi:peroxiredoxin
MNRSRALAFANGDGKDLALALTGAPLPAARLDSLRGHHLPLGDLTAGWLIVYCFPGSQVGTEESRLDDERDHHAYARCHAMLKRRAISVASLSSEPRDLQTQTMCTHRLGYHIILDPELRAADELGLPTLSDGELRAYKRLTLIARDGVIQRVFYPIARGGRSAQQALTWMEFHAGLDSFYVA